MSITPWNLRKESGNLGIELSADDIFDFVGAPDDYFLFGAKLNYLHKFFSIELRADNLLNTSYRSYTDRLRCFAYARGRNFSLIFGIDF